jgi:hypothetical protein
MYSIACETVGLVSGAIPATRMDCGEHTTVDLVGILVWDLDAEFLS